MLGHPPAHSVGCMADLTWPREESSFGGKQASGASHRRKRFQGPVPHHATASQ